MHELGLHQEHHAALVESDLEYEEKERINLRGNKRGELGAAQMQPH